jgi:nucleotidyltransferase/DNA polymerase involved in DNA repair
MRRVAAMAELKGMGLKNALALEEFGIKNVNDLTRQNPTELIHQIRALNQNVRLEEVNIWIRAAKRNHD